ncbi:MAG: proprotein convertase P-domain-containing protein [Thermocrispum sp.]
MSLRAKRISVACSAVVVAGALAVPAGIGAAAQPADPSDAGAAPAAEVAGVAKALDLTEQQARTRLAQQDEARETYKRLPKELVKRLSGHWFDAGSGQLTVAVGSAADAAKARSAGARAEIVDRTGGELDRLLDDVRALAGSRVGGLNSFGVDPRRNAVVVTVNRAELNRHGQAFLRNVRQLDGVRVNQVTDSPEQQEGEVNPGDPWWPGGESNCSVGFGATDADGGKHFVTAGHCTNDANQPAYGQQGQQNRLGTSNVGGTRSVNAREGDMGVVAVTESGWNLSASVNTWGEPAITVSGSAEAMVGDVVCHSGNTAPNFECGEVQKVNQTVDYGNTVVEGLTFTGACSQGGDSGGAWLSNDKAVGMHSGGYNDCPSEPQDGQSIFQPVNEALTKWGLTLYTADGGEDPGDPPGDDRTFGDETDHPIRDFQVTTSSVRSTATGAPANPVTVKISATHTCQQDLQVGVVSPGGRYYQLQRYGADGWDCTPFPGERTFAFAPVSEQAAAGTWTLRIGDNGPGDVGVLDAWSITL